MPDGIHLLSALSVLDFSQNKLSKLPDDLQHLCNLKTADFSDNELLSLPTSLHRCRKLHSLKVQNNPLKDGRLRKLANDPKASKPLLEYLRRFDESASKGKKGRVKNNSIVVVGDTEKSAAVDDPVGSKDVSGTVENGENASEPPIIHPYVVIERADDSEVIGTHFYVTRPESGLCLTSFEISCYKSSALNYSRILILLANSS